MSKKAANKKQRNSEIEKLDFLIGNWHTEGEVLETPANPAVRITGMDIYEWSCGGSVILHRVDVFMGNVRTEAIEIIGYDTFRKEYFMEAFDSTGEKSTMYATINKPGGLLLKGINMRSKLSWDKTGKKMTAKWERKEGDKNWLAWMNLKFRR